MGTPTRTDAERLLEPLVRYEVGLSAAFALVLSRPEGLRLFAEVMRTAAGPLHADAMARLCGDGPRPRVETEVHLANAGNLDIVVWSPVENVVLAIETKVGTKLSRNQLTKYRLALTASDPAGRVLADGSCRPERTVVQVLLSPGDNPLDRASDPPGFDAAVHLTFDRFAGDAWSAALDGALSQAPDLRVVLGKYVQDKIRKVDRGGSRAGTDAADHRGRLLDLLGSYLGAEGLRVERPSPLLLRLPDVEPEGPWTVRIGSGDRAHMSLTVPTLFPARAPDVAPERFVHLSAGWGAVPIPEPFPTAVRPWLPPEGTASADIDDGLADQAYVAAKVIREAIAVRSGGAA